MIFSVPKLRVNISNASQRLKKLGDLIVCVFVIVRHPASFRNVER